VQALTKIDGTELAQNWRILQVIHVGLIFASGPKTVFDGVGRGGVGQQ